MKYYTCNVKIEWTEEYEAESVEEFKFRVKEQFYEAYGIELLDEEIQNIQVEEV
jgi:hypothetical protein